MIMSLTSVGVALTLAEVCAPDGIPFELCEELVCAALRLHGCREWFINPLSVTYWWLAPFAVLPGLLGTILVFLDQQISTAIVNRKEHKLKVRHLLFFSFSSVLSWQFKPFSWNFCRSTTREQQISCWIFLKLKCKLFFVLAWLFIT